MNRLFRTTQAWNTALQRQRTPESAAANAQRAGPERSIAASASCDPSVSVNSDRTNTPVDPEEAAWIMRAREGETAAFEWLVTRYRDRAVRLAAHVLRRPAEAEDLAQEAFVRAFVQIRGFRGDAAFYTWLARIVIRLCLNRMRHPGWRRERELCFDAEEGEPSQPSDAERHANRLLIEMLLDRLTPALRATLVLREIDGLDYQEIADVLEIPVGTVRSRLNAARAQFRALWQSVLEETNHV